MQGDQHQIKKMRAIYNNRLYVKFELERELTITKQTATGNAIKETALLKHIIELQQEIIHLDKSINRLSGL